MRGLIAGAALLLSGLFSQALAASGQLPAIAMLEDYPDTQFVPPNIHRISYEPRIRAAFLKHPDGWRAVCAQNEFGDAIKCPKEQSTHFSKLYAHQKARVAEVDTRGFRKPESCCSGVGWLSVVSKSHVTHEHGDRLLQFGGHMHDPVLKPEVLVNRKGTPGDLEGWTLKASEAVPRNLSAAVAETMKGLLVCRKGGSQLPARIDVPWKDGHLMVENRFANRHGSALFQAQLSGSYLEDCKAAGGDVSSSTLLRPEFWIAVSPKDEVVVHVFKSKGNLFSSLQLIQFGDFDGDGKSEALFFRSGYNDDGYVLFHEEMTKTAKFNWGYH